MTVIAVHGVATAASNDYLTRWRAGWSEPIYRSGRWPSTGRFWRDALDMATEFRRRQAAVDAVGDAIRYAVYMGPVRAVVGHSMGDPIAQAAMRELGEEGLWDDYHRPRYVAIGSPLHHPIAGPILQHAFSLRREATHLSFRNRDDRVTFLGPFSRRFACTLTIAQPGDQGFREHLEQYYLGSGAVRRAISPTLASKSANR